MTEPPAQRIDHGAIGPYKLIDVLGEGGMGVVYRAEQTVPVRRRVALKVLKPGMDTEQVIARFESERQALAVMDHPNIAKVLDSGVTRTERPYFVMELVHGTPITHYADTHRLSVEERLRLFIDVCGAVQHAHHKGVIHRDLKPANVLVAVQESGPAVKVIDFGIAKAVGLGLTERTLVTRAGQILGTPEYMSPEQAEMSGLDVDTRTDIYSLGVMLYELLVGVLPFDLAAKPDYVITHTLRERDVPRPSTRLTSLGGMRDTVAQYRSTTPQNLGRELRGDLDWIILKAMEKDRTRRYETARGLANDINRHLDNEPVLARPPSTRDRMMKFVRRNRTGVMAGAVAMIALLAGAGAATAGFIHARAEQRRAEQSAATAQQVMDFLVDLFEVSDPGEARGNTVTAREVLDRGAERIAIELAEQPAVQATLMRAMGSVYANLGLHAAAIPLLERAIAVGESSRAVDTAELVHALQRLAITYRRQGRTQEAEVTLRRALELTRGAGPAESLQFASVARTLATVYQVLGRYPEADTLLKEALATQERLLGPDHEDVGVTLANLSEVYLTQRRPAEAEPHLRRSIAIAQRQLGPDHPTMAGLQVNLGTLYAMLERYEDAQRAYTRAYPVLETTLGPEHPTVAGVLNNLGEVYWAVGEYDRAEAHLLRSLAIKERALGPDHLSLASTLKALGNVRRDQSQFAEAEPLYRRALDLSYRTLDPSDPRVREIEDAYAELLRLTGRGEAADSSEGGAAGIRAARSRDRPAPAVSGDP
jgi:eukaryotic-like serine/threonine-protein kinase